MPILSIFFGIVVRMWHDDHPPPHIHVEYQGFEALVDNLMANWDRANVLNPWSAYRERTKMIKVLEARYLGDFQIELRFSDGSAGLFQGKNLLRREGSLLPLLRDENYFRRCFLDAGALCWPNGLELSPAKLYSACLTSEAA